MNSNITDTLNKILSAYNNFSKKEGLLIDCADIEKGTMTGCLSYLSNKLYILLTKNGDSVRKLMSDIFSNHITIKNKIKHMSKYLITANYVGICENNNLQLLCGTLFRLDNKFSHDIETNNTITCKFVKNKMLKLMKNKSLIIISEPDYYKGSSKVYIYIILYFVTMN